MYNARRGVPSGVTKLRVGFLVVSGLVPNLLVPNLNAQQMDEYRLKGAYLYNFAKFVDWPTEAFAGPSAPYTICVLGKDPFGQALDDMVAGKKIGARAIAVRRITDASQTAGCHILFVSSSQPARVLSVIAAAKQPGILTVGEAGSATSAGLIINLTLEGGKVRFEINLTEAEKEKLRLSSKLLSLSTVVRR